MKKIKVLITGIVMIGTIVVSGIAYAANQTNVTVTFDVDSVIEINAADCATGLSLSIDPPYEGYDTDTQSCEFTVRSNMPWDLSVEETDGQGGLAGDYEPDVRYDVLLGSEPHIIKDCDMTENSGFCDFTDAATESDNSEWGVYFTDGTTYGTQTLTPDYCNANNSGCKVTNSTQQVFDEEPKTTSVAEGVQLNVYLYGNNNVVGTDTYQERMTITAIID